jgi:hypothetical protein
MAEHVPYLLANRVDGNLFINLVDADWPEMGIVTRLHTRKLQLIMKAYRVRFARKKAGISDEDADEISEYAPSELSDIIGAEGGESDDDMSDDEDELEDGGERRLEIGSQGSDEELTEDHGFLNVPEVRICAPQFGSNRTMVSPDDLITYHRQWDIKILDAFKHLLEAEQPLLPILPKDILEKITAVANGEQKMESILNCYCSASSTL